MVVPRYWSWGGCSWSWSGWRWQTTGEVLEVLSADEGLKGCSATTRGAGSGGERGGWRDSWRGVLGIRVPAIMALCVDGGHTGLVIIWRRRWKDGEAWGDGGWKAGCEREWWGWVVEWT
jgi:hypothetical protein